MLIGKADNFHRRWMFKIPVSIAVICVIYIILYTLDLSKHVVFATERQSGNKSDWYQFWGTYMYHNIAELRCSTTDISPSLSPRVQPTTQWEWPLPTPTLWVVQGYTSMTPTGTLSASLSLTLAGTGALHLSLLEYGRTSSMHWVCMLACFTLHTHMHTHSIISFQDAFVDYVIPKTYFNDTDKSYYVSITVCVQLDHPANPGTCLISSRFRSEGR